jgi:hypothetical protein
MITIPPTRRAQAFLPVPFEPVTNTKQVPLIISLPMQQQYLFFGSACLGLLHTLHYDVQLPEKLYLDLCSSGMLSSADWNLVTDILVQCGWSHLIVSPVQENSENPIYVKVRA